MASDRLYELLSEALSQPSKKYRAAQEGLAIPRKALEGYEYGAEFMDKQNKRKMAGQTLEEVLSSSGMTMPKGTEGYGNLKYGQFEPTAKLISGLADMQKATSERNVKVDNSPDELLAKEVREGRMTLQDAYDLKNSGALLRSGFSKGENGTLVPVPGGKPAREIADTEMAKELARSNQLRKAKLVTKKIDEAIGNMGFTTTGAVGSVARNIPLIPTKAKDLSGTLNTIKSNISIDELMSMREASKTGGALGNVSDRENQMLADAAGALETEQTQDQLVSNLKEIRKRYSNIQLIIENRTGDREADEAIARVISSEIPEQEKRARIQGIRSVAGR